MRSRIVALVLFTSSACDDSTSRTPPTIEAIYPDGCDPIVDRSFCGYPFPSDVFTVADASSRTGRRVHFHRTEMRPLRYADDGDGYREHRQDPTIFDDLDGFAGGTPVLFAIPGGTLTGTASVTDIAASLAPDAKVVLVDADTGEKIANFVEFDAAISDVSRAAFYVQPAKRLTGGHRYLVAVRGIVDANGALLPPTDAFAALRDRRSLASEPSVATRRTRYEALFTRLEELGVPRDDLQLAWDFTVMSDATVTGRLRTMFERGVADLAGTAPTYTITSTTDGVTADIARVVRGTVRVPKYLTGTGSAGSTMTLDASGNPTSNGTFDVPFTLQIPTSAVGAGSASPKPVLQYGHGIFGNQTEADGSAQRQLANQHGYALLALDWWGLSGSGDLGYVSTVASTGSASAFRSVTDRGQQAMLNQFYGLRAVIDGLAADPATFIGGFPTIDPNEPRYLGVSLGGLYGGILATVSPDIGRSVLMVPGQPISLVLPRNSSTYQPLRYLLVSSLGDEAYPFLLFGLIETLGERCDPSGYTQQLPRTPTAELPFARAHRVLVMDAIGDKTVTTLGAAIMARSMGLPLLGPAARPVFGLSEVGGPIDGSAFVEFDFGPTESTTQLPNPAPGDPHGALIYGAGAAIPSTMAMQFLSTGIVTNLCSSACDPN